MFLSLSSGCGEMSGGLEAEDPAGIPTLVFWWEECVCVGGVCREPNQRAQHSKHSLLWTHIDG